MTTQTGKSVHQDYEGNPLDNFIVNRSRLTVALILIALGLVFFLEQVNILKMGGNWWVIFIAIPGFVALGSAVVNLLQVGKFNSAIVAQGLGGLGLLLISAIFIWDPTWNFTRGWQLDKTFPFLRNMGNLWQWLVLGLGVVLLFMAARQRSTTLAFTGAVVCIVGAVFILNISWNLVWPLFVMALGVGLLYRGNRSS